jgi:hypothetical protein
MDNQALEKLNQVLGRAHVTVPGLPTGKKKVSNKPTAKQILEEAADDMKRINYYQNVNFYEYRAALATDPTADYQKFIQIPTEAQWRMLNQAQKDAQGSVPYSVMRNL